MNDAITGIASLAAVAVGLCLLLRVARPRRDARDAISAWAILAGLAASTALGPAVLGRADPSLHARLITGVAQDSPAVAELDQARARIRADSMVGLEDDAAAEDVRRAEAAVAAQARAFAAPRHAACAALAVALIVMCWPRLRGTTTPAGTATLVAWTVTVPALLAYIAMRMWVGADVAASLCAAAACATGATFPTATAWRAARRSDGCGGSLVAHAGAWSVPLAGVAMMAAVVAALMQASEDGPGTWPPVNAVTVLVGIAAAACIVAPIAGRLLAAPEVGEVPRDTSRASRASQASQASRASRSSQASRAWRGAAIDALTAATVAAATATLDPFSWDFLWAGVILALIAEDGRWGAGWAACLLQGTHTSRDAARVGAMLEENSRAIVAFAAACAACGAVSAYEAALLCAAAWAIDLTWGVRRLIAVAPAKQVPRE